MGESCAEYAVSCVWCNRSKHVHRVHELDGRFYGRVLLEVILDLTDFNVSKVNAITFCEQMEE